MEEIVRRLKPIYMGFLLILYNPDFFNTVFSSGKPSDVDLPRLNILSILNKRPDNSMTKAAFFAMGSDTIERSKQFTSDRMRYTQVR